MSVKGLRKKSELEQLLCDLHSHNINHHTREIFLHSSLSPLSDDDEPGVEYRMAVRFIKNLYVLENQNSQNPQIYLFSPHFPVSSLLLSSSLYFSDIPTET